VVMNGDMPFLPFGTVLGSVDRTLAVRQQKDWKRSGCRTASILIPCVRVGAGSPLLEFRLHQISRVPVMTDLYVRVPLIGSLCRSSQQYSLAGGEKGDESISTVDMVIIASLGGDCIVFLWYRHTVQRL